MATLSLDTAQELVESVQAIPGVHSMHAGRFGEVALLYPKQRVQGVRFLSTKESAFEVDIVASYGAGNLYELAHQVRELATSALAKENIDLPVRVVIADTAAEDES